jgi:hypothetical protein
MHSEAYISGDRLYRYWLLRVWNPALPIYALIGSNPSTADESKDDHTIRKEIGFGENLGFGGLLKLNVGAFRATDPKVWAASTDPFGPENTVEHLQWYLVKFAPALVVAAWGRPCLSCERGRNRAYSVKQFITGMKCWGKNADGSPRHPLMLPYTTELQPFN